MVICGAFQGLANLFTMASKDETLFPPWCCGPILFDIISGHLSFDQLHRLHFAAMEFSNPPVNRTYCADPNCATFILPGHVHAGIGDCQECHKMTCTICKQAAHEGDCPEDPAVQATLTLAQELKWRQCGQCQRMVELNLGCNHIT